MFYRVSKLSLADIGRVKCSGDDKYLLVDDVPLKKVIVRKIDSGLYPQARDFRGNTYGYFRDCGYNYEGKVGQIMIGRETPLSYFVKEPWIRKDIILGVEEGLTKGQTGLNNENILLQSLENILSLDLQLQQELNEKRNIDPIVKALMDLVKLIKDLPSGKRQLEFSRIVQLGYSYVDAMLAIANGTVSVSPETVMDNAIEQIEIIKSGLKGNNVIPFIRIRSGNNDRK